MKLHVEWGRPIQLRDASKDNMIYSVDLNRVGTGGGVYIFWPSVGQQFEALYVGKAGDSIRGRIKSHLLRSSPNGEGCPGGGRSDWIHGF
jgi:hypothetical protein